MAKEEVVVYTDGSVFRNPDGSGWAAVLVDGEAVTGYASGCIRGNISSDRAELMAITVGARLLTRGRGIREVYCDNHRLVDTIDGMLLGGRTPHTNSDLFETVIQMVRDGMRLTWIKGHNGDFYNSLADTLAREAAYRASNGKKSRMTMVRLLQPHA